MNSIYKHLRESRILNEKQDYANMTPEELATLSKGGDQLAISTLINKLDSDGFFYKMTKKYIPEGTMGSDDIYQTAQIGVWDAIQKWDGSGEFEAFAGMIVKNKLVDAFRHLDTDTARANRDTRSVSSIDDESDDDEVHGDMSASEYNSYIKTTSHKSSEDEYFDSEGVKAITDFLQNECSDQEQQVIKLYIDGYKMAQISEMTGMKYKSCENALRRAKEKLSVFVKSMEESRKILRESALLSNQEKEILRQAFAMMEGSQYIDDSTDVDEHLEVAPNDSSTTAQKVDYVKKMVKKAKLEGDEHSAWDIVDFLWDSMLLDKIPLNESVDEEQPTQEEIDQATDRLAAILSELEDIYIDISEVRSWEEFSDKLKRAEELGHEVALKFEDEFNDEDVNDLVEECNNLRRKIENADYEGPSENPMTAAGMKMSDFI